MKKPALAFLRLLWVLTGILNVPAAFGDERTLDNLDRAISICDQELDAAASGKYSSYRPETVRNALADIRNLADEAEHTSRSPVTSDLIALVDQRIGDEVADSYRWRNYSLLTTATVLRELRSMLAAARRYDSTPGGH